MARSCLETHGRLSKICKTEVEEEQKATASKWLQRKRCLRMTCLLRRFHLIRVIAHKSNQLHISHGMDVSVVRHLTKTRQCFSVHTRAVVAFWLDWWTIVYNGLFRCVQFWMWNKKLSNYSFRSSTSEKHFQKVQAVEFLFVEAGTGFRN